MLYFHLQKYDYFLVKTNISNLILQKSGWPLLATHYNQNETQSLIKFEIPKRIIIRDVFYHSCKRFMVIGQQTFFNIITQ